MSSTKKVNIHSIQEFHTPTRNVPDMTPLQMSQIQSKYLMVQLGSAEKPVSPFPTEINLNNSEPKFPISLQILETLIKTYKKDQIFSQSLLKLIQELKVDFIREFKQK